MRDVVNEKDEIVGRASKEEVAARNLICRVCFIMLINNNGELLLHRRSANKKSYPLYWSGAAAGHVNSGETYEQAASRELMEEIGAEARLEFIGKFFSAEDREMVGIFLGHYDGPLKIEPLEVDKIEYLSPERLRRQLSSMKATSYLERSLPLVLAQISGHRGR
jgi:isopentenyl-diphosphate Delta-isomerase